VRRRVKEEEDEGSDYDEEEDTKGAMMKSLSLIQIMHTTHEDTRPFGFVAVVWSAFVSQPLIWKGSTEDLPNSSIVMVFQNLIVCDKDQGA
jgi:hypothetical protein